MGVGVGMGYGAKGDPFCHGTSSFIWSKTHMAFYPGHVDFTFCVRQEGLQDGYPEGIWKRRKIYMGVIFNGFLYELECFDNLTVV